MLGMAAKADESLTFETHIRPIFRAHCFDCHGAGETHKGSLDLRLRRLMVQGGESGAAIVPGKPQASLLIQRLRDGEMPPGEAKVPDAEIRLLEQWIAQGARTARPEPKELGAGIGISPEERSFWSFQPVRRPTLPRFAPRDRVRTAIDALLLAKLKPVGLGFSPEADRRTLIIRAYLDLLGLPPSQVEIENFEADRDPAAYERLIDRLLASPRYGERWGRHWLDVAGYADSEGYTNDSLRKYAYKYRDYVIQSLNADKPLDRFLQEQLAGDELLTPPYRNLKPEQIELLVATGFLRMAADNTQAKDEEAGRNQVVAIDK